MTARRDIDHLIRTYLEDGPAELPDRSYDAVRAQIDHTRQRLVFGPWRKPQLSKFAAFATAAAAVLVVAAVVGINLIPQQGSIGGPDLTASPTSVPATSAPTAALPTGAPPPTADGSPVVDPSASPTATLIEPLSNVELLRRLPAGTYYVDDPFPVQASFTVPSGWRVWAYTPAATQINLEKPAVGEVSLEIVDNVTANPCTEELLDPPVGPSVGELVTALTNLGEFGFEVSPATDITVDGFRGMQLTLQAPVNGTCEGMRTWRTTTRQNGVGPGETDEVRILDVNGVRLLISVAHRPDQLSPEARSEIDALLDSFQISE